MLPVRELAAFTLATFGESINPGPTVATLATARTRSRQEAWGVVVGVALANIGWVIIVVLFAGRLSSWPEAEPLLKAFGALLLVHIATRASVSATITGIEAYILKKWGTPNDTKYAATSFVGGVRRGFVVHLFNPLSFTYYLGAYSGTLATDPSLALVFSVIAVLVDLLVYGVFAFLPVERLLKPSPTAFAAQRVFALLASFAMLFLVAHVFAIDRGHDSAGELHGLRNLFMLLGFLAGAIWEAEVFAARYGKTKNKLLWRGVLVWQSAFGTFAIIGTFLSVLVRIDPGSFGIPNSLISAVAICSLVAAVATAALSYARARGEMLDETANESSPGMAENLTRTLRLNSPKFMFLALLAGLALLGAFFAIAGFPD